MKPAKVNQYKDVRFGVCWLTQVTISHMAALTFGHLNFIHSKTKKTCRTLFLKYPLPKMNR